MRVLALDPGERVGWARADVNTEGGSPGYSEAVPLWNNLRHGITPLKDMAVAIASSLDIAAGYNGYDDCGRIHADYDLVIMEDWRLRADKAREFAGSNFPAVQFIGMVRLCCWLSNTKLVMQAPKIKATADKTLASMWPEMHQKVTRPLKHDDAHDLDAIRHLWFWTWDTILTAQPQEAA